jgi:phage virion morphogenesis protein
MAGTNSVISIDYDSQPVADLLTRMLDQVQDLTPPMMEIAEYLHEKTRDRFDQQQAPDGTPWHPLAASTKKAKQRKGVPVDKILHGQTLNLRDTIYPFWGAQEAGVSTGPGTEAYAATQQFGDDGRNIPARPFLGLSDEDEQEVIDILGDFLDDAL